MCKKEIGKKTLSSGVVLDSFCKYLRGNKNILKLDFLLLYGKASKLFGNA